MSGLARGVATLGSPLHLLGERCSARAVLGHGHRARRRRFRTAPDSTILAGQRRGGGEASSGAPASPQAGPAISAGRSTKTKARVDATVSPSLSITTVIGGNGARSSSAGDMAIAQGRTSAPASNSVVAGGPSWSSSSSGAAQQDKNVKGNPMGRKVSLWACPPPHAVPVAAFRPCRQTRIRRSWRSGNVVYSVS